MSIGYSKQLWWHLWRSVGISVHVESEPKATCLLASFTSTWRLMNLSSFHTTCIHIIVRSRVDFVMHNCIHNRKNNVRHRAGSQNKITQCLEKNWISLFFFTKTYVKGQIIIFLNNPVKQLIPSTFEAILLNIYLLATDNDRIFAIALQKISRLQTRAVHMFMHPFQNSLTITHWIEMQA